MCGTFDKVMGRTITEAWPKKVPAKKKAPGKDNLFVAALRKEGLSRDLARKAYKYSKENAGRDEYNVASLLKAGDSNGLWNFFPFKKTDEGSRFWTNTMPNKYVTF